MTDLQGECSYRRAEEEDKMQRRSSDCSQNPPVTEQETLRRWSGVVCLNNPHARPAAVLAITMSPGL